MPVLRNACLNCHNPDKKKAGLDLSNYSSALTGSPSGRPRRTSAATPGSSAVAPGRSAATPKVARHAARPALATRRGGRAADAAVSTDAAGPGAPARSLASRAAPASALAASAADRRGARSTRADPRCSARGMTRHAGATGLHARRTTGRPATASVSAVASASAGAVAAARCPPANRKSDQNQPCPTRRHGDLPGLKSRRCQAEHAARARSCHRFRPAANRTATIS